MGMWTEKTIVFWSYELLGDDILPIHYVAMTLPKNGSEPGIRYYGTVIRASKVKRSTIPFPSGRRNPDEEYYAFVVKEWIPLGHPVLPFDDYVYEPKFCSLSFNLFLLGATRK